MNISELKVLLVTGDRNWTDDDVIFDALSKLMPDILIEGEARGADEISANWADANGYTDLNVGQTGGWNSRPSLSPGMRLDCKRLVRMRADWNRHGRAAGPLRNEIQCRFLTWCRKHGAECHVYAFHDHLDESKGTKNMVNLCRRNGFEVVLFMTAGTKQTISWSLD